MSVEIVLGPMFSGKTSYVLEYVRKYHAIGKKVSIIKPLVDNRYSNENFVVSHNNEKLTCRNWDTRIPLCQYTDAEFYDYFVIEEAQFFTHLHHFCSHILFELKKHILVVGLNGDAEQTKFGEILDIIPMATSLKKLSAMCSVCKDGTPAHYTKAFEKSENQINVGGAEKYVAVCLRHL